MLKKAIVCVLAMVLISLCSGCESGKDIAETASPSGVSQEATSSQPEVESTPESVESEEEDPKKEINIAYPLKMIFGSAENTFSTELTLYSDGSFEGVFNEKNAAEIGDEYPNGTVYTCEFSGKFSELRYVNDYTYALSLESVVQKGKEGEIKIQDGVLYKTSFPHGIYNTDSTAPTKNFLLYTPVTPISKLNESFKEWWPLRLDENNYQNLMVYGLRNTETEDGFFSVLQ